MHDLRRGECVGRRGERLLELPRRHLPDELGRARLRRLRGGDVRGLWRSVGIVELLELRGGHLLVVGGKRVHGVPVRVHYGERRCGGVDGLHCDRVPVWIIWPRRLLRVVRRWEVSSLLWSKCLRFLCRGSIWGCRRVDELHVVRCGLLLGIGWRLLIVRLLELLLWHLSSLVGTNFLQPMHGGAVRHDDWVSELHGVRRGYVLGFIGCDAGVGVLELCFWDLLGILGVVVLHELRRGDIHARVVGVGIDCRGRLQHERA